MMEEGVDQGKGFLGRGIIESYTNVDLRSKRMETIFTSRYYKLNRLFLSIVGIWPYDDPRDSLIRKIRIYITLTIAILSQIFALIKSDLSLQTISSIFTFLVPSLCVLTCYQSTSSHSKMKIMIEHMNYDWYHLISDKERPIIEEYASRIRIYTIINIVMYFSIILLYMLPVTSRFLFDLFVSTRKTQTYEIPFKIEIFIDQQRYIFFVLILSYIVLFFLGISTNASYMLFVIYFQHACGLLDIIGNMLKHAFDTGTYNKCTEKDIENITMRIIRCVLCHTRTIRFIDNINSTFQTSIIIHLIFGFLMIFIAFYQVLSVEDITKNKRKFFVELFYMIIIILWLSLFSYLGQMLLNKSAEILNNAYNSMWYLAPYKMQQLLLIIMIRCDKLSALIIGKTFVTSLELATSMLHNAISYAMVIRSIG
ncbi:uncharacterized protein LOC124947641 [Vespa velutina]|uniref:uncharacterized protein LOC124947641 n=1 Tax=Vespa velutina TaxID=202808 RepID=UPI001FB40956|nr:uncharacterized protein LOC124947641 [Vespa velutina]